MKDIEQLRADIQLHIDYLLAKVRERDWHGVSDAANDLREMEVELKGKQEMHAFLLEVDKRIAAIEKAQGK